MSAMEELRASMAAKFEAIFPHLDERQRLRVPKTPSMACDVRVFANGR
ncbi:hypothetical protein [Actinacidiphila oryziradicis]|nr:hypothetical protein [Actinacidiphila oryziradicis]